MRTLVRQALLIAAIALPPAVGEALYFRDRISWRQPAPTNEITATEAQAFGKQAIWIDARLEEDFLAGHVPGALLLNSANWDNLLPKVLNTWSPGRKLVVYCSAKSCDASHEVARRLKEEAGLNDVYVLSGGWEAWKKASHESLR